MEVQKFETEWGGKTLSIETGKYAKQASGSVLVQYGDTVVLAAATMSDNKREGLDFFPLMVEFEEKMYAAGRIKGSRFMKKEGRPTDEAILTARFIDRALRPLFDDRIRNDIQVVVTCLAFDGENDPDVIGLLAAVCALHISDIPWEGPIGAIRVGQVEGEWVINPSYEARSKSIIDLSFAGTSETVIMVEAGGQEVPEETVLEAFWFGQKHLAKPIELIERVRKAVGKEKREGLITIDEDKEKVEELARPFIKEKVQELFFGTPRATKSERNLQKKELKAKTEKFLLEQGVEPDHVYHGSAIVYDVLEEEVSREILENNKRVDGRSLTDVRELICEVQVLPRVHGSGHFSRGETQVVSVTTLGSPRDEQTMDGMEIMGTKRYFHHYNFPPYSVGEVKPMRGPGRRDIGHGALAEKALLPVLPKKEDFPYTIQVVSEVLGSNGSSSMASTCGSALALMDAGVPIKATVAGIAMGVATNDKGDWKVITDLQDLEDGKGGMDFKLAGTRKGITAIQMDTKTKGLSKELVTQTFKQGLDGIMHVLDMIEAAIPEPRTELSQYAPRIISIKINPERIGDVIGPGGKVINEIIATTGVQSIDIEDDGLVLITSTNAEGAKRAEEAVYNLTREVEKGEVFEGKVVRIMDFGAFVEILPKKDGMVHISELAPWRVEKVNDIVKIGDKVHVKVLEIDNMGRINLSMKQAEGNEYPPAPPKSSPSANTKNRAGGRQYDKKPRK